MKTNKVPLYAKIRAYIKNKIDSGQLRPGDKVPTEAELMEHFQVSRVTITTSLKQLVEDGLIYRIAGKGTFVKGDEAAEGAQQLSGIPPKPIPAAVYKNLIGAIMLPASDLFTYKLLLAIEERCNKDDYGLLMRSSWSQQDEIKAIREMVEIGIKGLIIYPQEGEAYNEAILELKLQQYPFVLLDRYLPGIKTNALVSDNYNGGVIAAEHLIALGHRTIGVVSSARSKTSSSEDRFQGYLDTIKKHSLPIRPHHWLTRISDDQTEFKPGRTVGLIKSWLTDHPDLTAVFALQSPDAEFTATAAEELGLRVPEDLSILSFDNPGLADRHKHMFTHIEQNLRQLGWQAADLLLHTIQVPEHSEQVYVPVSLVQGYSTGPAKR